MITAFVDASVCSETKAAGWGCWAAKNGVYLTFGGAFKIPMDNCNEAEVSAVVKALYMLDSKGWFSDMNRLCLQLDSAHALGFLQHAVGAVYYRPPVGRKPNTVFYPNRASGQIILCESLITKLQKRYELEFRVTHVKGHRNGDGRQYVNSTADRIARKNMRKAREKLGVSHDRDS